MRFLSIPVLLLLLLAPCAVFAAAGAHSAEILDASAAEVPLVNMPAVRMLPEASLRSLAVPVAAFVPRTVSTAMPQPAQASVGWFQSMSQRFGNVGSMGIYRPAQFTTAVPAFGHIGLLPMMGGGMLRRFPQAPENFSQEMLSISRAIRNEMRLSAGTRALDVAHGMVASLGLSTRLGRISVERGELQGRTGLSMRPVTIFRLELPLFNR